jgi:phospholipase/lecithinase/hemolysin
MFFDLVHPTTQTHQVLSGFIQAAVVPEPPTLVLLAAGMALLGVARRRRAVRGESASRASATA